MAAATSSCRIRLSPIRNVEIPSTLELSEVGRGIQTTFGDGNTIAWDFWRETFADVERGLEGAQISIVDADEARFQLEGPVKLIFIMNFNEDVHTHTHGGIFDRARGSIIDRRHDDEDAISAKRA